MAGAAAGGPQLRRGAGRGRHKMAATLKGEGGHVGFGMGALLPEGRALLQGAVAAWLSTGENGGPAACLLLTHPSALVPSLFH